jgi:hypothetical protein
MHKKVAFVIALVIAFIVTAYVGMRLIGLMVGSIVLAISGILFYEVYHYIKFLTSSEIRENKEFG